MVCSEPNFLLITLKLITAYQNANYFVLIKENFKFNIGIFSKDLHDLLMRKQTKSGFFMTAYNPQSKLVTEVQNERAHEQLKSNLIKNNILFLDALSTDPKTKWSPEYGFIILGINKEEIYHLGVQFGQNALVYFDLRAIPRLLLYNNLSKIYYSYKDF